MGSINPNIAVVGLGYVGLPLAAEFARLYNTLGFDLNGERVRQLCHGNDVTGEVEKEVLVNLPKLKFTNDVDALRACNVFIVAVPTPANQRRPDLSPLLSVSEMLGNVLKAGDYVIFESTVYPGVTEDECVPILEEVSGLKHRADFFVGYSPERINPGDKERKLTTIKKIVAGSTVESGDFIERLYGSIISAGVHRTTSIKVAEAAKVVENVQRDVNIGLINELSMIFARLGIDTEEVLQAAETKWNFLRFRPGLVGGHCIGVDSYYLAHKAKEVGHYPKLISSSRGVNEDMAQHVTEQLVRAMLRKCTQINGAKVLIMGLAFKENCSDLRNTKVVDIVSYLDGYGVLCDVYDPYVDKRQAETLYGIKPILYPETGLYDAIVIAVAHDDFREIGVAAIRSWGKTTSTVYDLKYLLDKNDSDLRL